MPLIGPNDARNGSESRDHLRAWRFSLYGARGAEDLHQSSTSGEEMNKFDLRLVLLLLAAASALQWHGASDQAQWAFGCDFRGNDLLFRGGNPSECVAVCKAVSGCSHFTWTFHGGGTCWLKGGAVSETSAVSIADPLVICGLLKRPPAASSVVKTIAIRPQWRDAEHVRWASGCHFYGNDLAQRPGDVRTCAAICISESWCSHFTWTDDRAGTCWIKSGPVSEGSATYESNSTAVCGLVTSRPEPPAAVVKNATSVSAVGTYWDERTDSGGCALPRGDYVITDAMALGQAPSLGHLKYRQGLCGQVLQVDCGYGPVDAIVASGCSLNTPSCGVDLIGKTWRRATSNQRPGIVKCRVSLTNKNPLRNNGPVCYHRPDSDLGNTYFTIIGVLNTSGRIPTSAVAAGVSGKRSNDGWFQFNAGGRSLLKKDAPVTFNFDDGSSESFRLADCKPSIRTHIFQ